MVNILLIDQEPLFQQAFARMIAETEECQLIGIAENSKEAFEIVSRYHWYGEWDCGMQSY